MRFSSQYAILLGAAAAFVLIGYGLVKMYSSASVPQARALEPVIVREDATSIMVAAREVRRGQVIGMDDITEMSIYGVGPSGAFRSPEALIGRVATLDLVPGQIFLAATVSSDPAAAGLAALVPEGYRALGVRINEEIGVGSFVQAGDIVDVLVVLSDQAMPERGSSEGDRSEAYLLLQAVRVLSVGPTLSPQKGEKGETAAKLTQARDVTVAVTPEQLARFALARGLGTYYLALRNPMDTDLVSARAVTLEDVRGPERARPAAVADGRHAVEVIRGATRSIIYSGLPERSAAR